MADVTLTYNGQNILEMSASGTKTLKAAGKICKTDIEVAYVKSGGGGSGYNILKGISPPSAAVGQDGDVYLQYFELPSGYTLLKYVQSDGSQWVDTGYMPSQATSAVIKFNPQYVGESAVFGAEWSMNGFLLSFYNNVLRWHSSSYADCPVSVNQDYLVKVSNTSMIVNDTVFSVDAGAVSQYAIRLFLPTNDHNNGRKGRYKLYYFQIFEADTLVMQLIPARRDSDSVVGLYDTVNNNFHASGVGTLAAGSDAIDGEIVNTYVKVNGAWQELVGADVDDVADSGMYTGSEAPPPASLGSDGDYYYQRGIWLLRSIQSVKPSASINGSQTRAYGMEFTVTQPVTVTSLFAMTVVYRTPGKLQLGTTSEILAEIGGVTFPAYEWVEVPLESPIQLATGTNYVVKVTVDAYTGNVAYVNGISNLTCDSNFSYVRARYSTSWPGSAESGICPLVGISYLTNDGVYKIRKQFYKSSGSWSEIT